MTTIKFVRFHKLQNTLTSVHSGFKLCTSMPEDGRGRPEYVACTVGFNIFVVFDGNK